MDEALDFSEEAMYSWNEQGRNENKQTKEDAKQTQNKSSLAVLGAANTRSRRRTVTFNRLALAFLLALSLTHLQAGLAAITGDHWVLSLLLACGIDWGLIAAEAAYLQARLDKDQLVQRSAGRLLVVTLILSGLLNIQSYGAYGLPEWGLLAARVGLGSFIPWALWQFSLIQAVLSEKG